MELCNSAKLLGPSSPTAWILTLIWTWISSTTSPTQVYHSSTYIVMHQTVTSPRYIILNTTSQPTPLICPTNPALANDARVQKRIKGAIDQALEARN